MMSRMISVPLATKSPPCHSAERPSGFSTISCVACPGAVLGTVAVEDGGTPEGRFGSVFPRGGRLQLCRRACGSGCLSVGVLQGRNKPKRRDREAGDQELGRFASVHDRSDLVKTVTTSAWPPAVSLALHDHRSFQVNLNVYHISCGLPSTVAGVKR